MLYPAKDPNFFSLKIHHGGMFSESPGRKYVNGRFSFVDNIDVDLFSVIELNEMILMLGYEGDRIMYYQYLIPDLDLDHGLRALGSDQMFMNLVGMYC